MAIISWWPFERPLFQTRGQHQKQQAGNGESMMAGSQPFAVSQVSGIYSVHIEYMSNGPHEHTHALTKYLSDFSCWDPFDLVECCAASMNSLTLPQNVLQYQVSNPAVIMIIQYDSRGYNDININMHIPENIEQAEVWRLSPQTGKHNGLNPIREDVGNFWPQFIS